MREVYPLWRLIVLLVRESSRHVGAAATSAALRETLDRERLVSVDQFDRSFAASRLTPGTNLIALYAALGGIVAGPLGAVAAVTIGLLPAALMSIAVCAFYLTVGESDSVTQVVRGASAAAWAVLVWSASRFLVPPARQHLFATALLVLLTLGLGSAGVPIVVLLLLSAVFGALLLKPQAP